MRDICWQKVRKVIALLLLDLLFVLLSLLVACVLVNNDPGSMLEKPIGVLGAVVLTLPVFALFGFYNMSIKNAGFEEMMRICLGVLVSFVL